MGSFTFSSHICKDTPDDSLPCLSCGYIAQGDEARELLEFEDSWIEAVSEPIIELDRLKEMYNEVMKTFNGMHWVCYKLDSLIIPHLKDSRSSIRILALQRRVSYLEKLRFPTYSLAWATQDLAEYFMLSEDIESLKSAAQLIQKSYWIMRSITGPGPYCDDIETKMIAVIDRIK